MIRRLLNLVTALSLLLFLAVCALWARGYWVSDSFKRIQPYVDDEIELGGGGVTWMRSEYGVHRNFYVPPEFGVWRHSSDEPHPSLSRTLRDGGTPAGWLNFAGFLTGRHYGDPAELPSRAIGVPYWAVFLFVGIAPALIGIRRLRGRRRRDPGLCPRCGYDLRATPGRCPECGTIASPPATP